MHVCIHANTHTHRVVGKTPVNSRPPLTMSSSLRTQETPRGLLASMAERSEPQSADTDRLVPLLLLRFCDASFPNNQFNFRLFNYVFITFLIINKSVYDFVLTRDLFKIYIFVFAKYSLRFSKCNVFFSKYFLL